MKKVLLFLIVSFVVIPCFVNAEDEYCADENLINYRQELGQSDYKYSIEYEDIKNKDKNGFPTNYINISITNLSNDFFALTEGDRNYTYEISFEPTKVSGGVHKIYFYHKDCPENVLKEEEIFLPYYSKGKTKAFDDGSLTKSVSNKNIIITVVLSIATIGLFVLAIFMLKKGRKK